MFGVANQLLAAIALGIGTTLILKAGRANYVWVTLVPMCFMFATTFTAAWKLIGMFGAGRLVGLDGQGGLHVPSR